MYELASESQFRGWMVNDLGLVHGLSGGAESVPSLPPKLALAESPLVSVFVSLLDDERLREDKSPIDNGMSERGWVQLKSSALYPTSFIKILARVQ